MCAAVNVLCVPASAQDMEFFNECWLLELGGPGSRWVVGVFFLRGCCPLPLPGNAPHGAPLLAFSRGIHDNRCLVAGSCKARLD